MTPDVSTLPIDELLQENQELRRRLEEAEDALRALRAGEVDAVVVETDEHKIYTLEATDKPYRLLVEQMPQAAATLTMEGAILFCNERFAELLQQALPDLRGKLLPDLVAPASRGAVESMLRDAPSAPVQREVMLATADAGTARVHLGITALREGALGRCLIVTDLTEQRNYEELRRTQAALRDSEKRLAEDLADTKLLQGVSIQLIQEDNTETLYQEIVEAASRLLRSDMASMQVLHPETNELKLLASKGFHPESAAFWQSVGLDSDTSCGESLRKGERVIVPDVESGATSGTGDLDAYRRSGIRGVQSTPLLARGGRLLGMISTHWRWPHRPSERDLRLIDVLARQAADLLERKRTEQDLQASEERLRAILDHMPAVVYLVDDQQRFRFINRHWKTVFDLANEQVVGRPLADFFPREVAEQFAATNREVMRTRCPAECEEVVQLADGPHTYISSKVPLLDSAGAAYGICGISIDITQRKQSECALRDADRRKDEFLATLAHELRNPLAPIRNAAQLLQAKGPPIPELQWARGVIDRQVRLMARLLEDLLDVSRISRGKLALRREPVELARVIDTALETSRPAIDAGGHQLTVRGPSEPIPLEADAVRLAQVFANLLNNAAKFTEPGGRIDLTVERQGSDAVVSVKDNGIGIAPTMLAHIFEIFSQEEPALVRSQDGLGIGLSLVKGLVELHGGSVEARSAGLGKGSEFIVRLPVIIAAPLREPARTSPDPLHVSATRQRILIVDDNRDSADSLAKLLTLMGHDVGAAYDGEQAVREAETFRPDVMLLDIGMPKLDGYGACRRIREQPWGAGIYLVAVTGWGQEEDRRRTQEAGFNEHMVKPVDPGALMDLLAALPVPHQV